MRLYTITGCGGIGKDSILSELLNKRNDLVPIVSVTSRPMRKLETEGKEYRFISNSEAKQMIDNNKFIEKRIYEVISKDGKGEQWIYGISKNSIDLYSDNTYIVIVDYNGRQELQKYLEENDCLNNLTTLYIDGSYQVRLQRYLNRESMTNPQVLEAIRRFKDDNKNVVPAKYDSDYVIKNEGKLENTVNRILNIMEEDI